MRAWRVHEFGEPQDVLVQEDVPEPSAADLTGLGMSMGGWVPAERGRHPYDDWVVLDMTVAALALPDVTMARGTYPVPVDRPYTSGQEGVGIVTDAAPHYRHLMGKRVVATCIQPFGSLAPVAIGVGTIFEVPDGMSDEDGAGFVIPAYTGYHVIHRRAQVQAGETVAVLGAAGGLGAAYVQLCLAAGARVIAIVGGPEKVAFVEELGAEGVDHLDPDVDVVAAVLRADRRPGRGRHRRSGAGRGRRRAAGRAGARRAPRAVRSRRRADRPRPALLRAQPHAGGGHARRVLRGAHDRALRRGRRRAAEAARRRHLSTDGDAEHRLRRGAPGPHRHGRAADHRPRWWSGSADPSWRTPGRGGRASRSLRASGPAGPRRRRGGHRRDPRRLHRVQGDDGRGPVHPPEQEAAEGVPAVRTGEGPHRLDGRLPGRGPVRARRLGRGRRLPEVEDDR